MPLKLRIRAQLATCGTCGKPKGNPFTHVCVTRLDRPRRPGRTTVRPKVSASLAACGSCGQSYANPITHVCAPKSDFRKRAAADARRRAAEEKKRKAAARRAKAAARPARPSHNYRTCRDKDCTRAACEAYREGFEDGAASASEE
jgi:transcription elongation factor Elf1